MRLWIIVGVIVMAAVTNASAQSDRPALPPISSTPNPGCEARTGGLAVPAQGETTGSANLSDELSRSKGVICPPAEIDPSISVPHPGAVSCQSSHRPALLAVIPTSFPSNEVC
jgi:hypothetical protein